MKKNKGRRRYAQTTHEYALRLHGGRRVLATTRAVSDAQAWGNFLFRHNRYREIPEITIYSDRGDFDIKMVEDPPLLAEPPF